jgi:hypothetical protein
MADIRKQIGLDFLRTRGISPEQGQEKAALGLSAAVIAYGKALLSAVRKAEPQPARLHEVVEQINIPIDAALAVVSSFEDQGYLSVVDRDLKGNHALRLTAAGAALLR